MNEIILRSFKITLSNLVNRKFHVAPIRDNQWVYKTYILETPPTHIMIRMRQVAVVRLPQVDVPFLNKSDDDTIIKN